MQGGFLYVGGALLDPVGAETVPPDKIGQNRYRFGMWRAVFTHYNARWPGGNTELDSDTSGSGA